MISQWSMTVSVICWLMFIVPVIRDSSRERGSKTRKGWNRTLFNQTKRDRMSIFFFKATNNTLTNKSLSCCHLLASRMCARLIGGQLCFRFFSRERDMYNASHRQLLDLLMVLDLTITFGLLNSTHLSDNFVILLTHVVFRILSFDTKSDYGQRLSVSYTHLTLPTRRTV